MRNSILCVVLTLCLALPAMAQLSESDVQLLKSTIEKYLANNEAIRTWTGVASFESITYGDNNTETRRTKAGITFAADKPKSLQHSVAKTEVDQYVQDGKKQTQDLSSNGYLVMEDSAYSYRKRIFDANFVMMDNTNFDNRGMLQLSSADQYLRMGMGHPSWHFNPFALIDGGGKHVLENIDRIVEGASELQAQMPYTLTRTGDLITLAIESKGTTMRSTGTNQDGEETFVREELTRTTAFTFDISKGGVLVHHGSSSGTGNSSSWNVEWENVSGVWVPKKVKSSSDAEVRMYSGPVRPVGDGQVREGNSPEYRTERRRNENEVVFFEHKINEPIPSSVFAIKNLGVKKGDRYMDTKNVERDVNGRTTAPFTTVEIDDKFLSTLEAEAKALATGGKSSMMRYLVMGTIGVLVVAGLVVAFRRWQASHSEG